MTTQNPSLGELNKGSTDQSVNTSVAQTLKKNYCTWRAPKYIESQNIKFENFVNMLMKSKLKRDDIAKEIIDFCRTKETLQNKKLIEMRLRVDRERNRRIFNDSHKVNQASLKNELETIFVDCIEEVRTNIMKRRLKSELITKKKFKNFDQQTEEATQFEESLLKLAQFSKGRIKLADFSPQDKQSLLDLFVNNEKTLLKIYEALFPHNTNTLASTDHNLSYRSNDLVPIGTLNESSKHVRLLDDQQYVKNFKKNMQVLENYEKSSRNMSIANIQHSADCKFL